MKDDEIFQRYVELLKQEDTNDEAWLWLSFVDETGFLGVYICKAKGMMHAMASINQKRLNPGGQVICYELAQDPNEFMTERLLNKEEATEMSKLL